MIANVNLMQDPNDIIFDEQTSYSKEYLVQALANLGQRIGIKGDGISYKSFNFNDIILNNTLYNSDKYIGYIEYINDEYNNVKALFGIAEKNNLESYKTIDNTVNIDNTLIFNSELSFSVPINGIEKYSKNSLCINNDKELTFMLVGKQFGYDDDDDNNSVLLYYKFNILTNKLINGYKIFHFMKNDDTDYYCLLRLNNDTTNIYTFDIKIFSLNIFDNLIDNDNYLIDNYKTYFKNLFNFNSYSKSADIPFSILNKEYESIKNLESYNTNLDFNSVISLILNADINTYLIHNKSVELIYDSAKNELLSTNKFEDIKDFFYNEYKLNLNEIIFEINEDINKLYVNIFNYYNNKFYLERRATLVKRILLKLYEKSINYKEILGKRLYIPLDYEFHYICNSNNELNIYYSNNIYVTYTSLDNIDLSEFWKSNNNLVLDYENLNKLKVYNFEINYNTYIENLINSVYVKEIYTMPYINAFNNWSINDSDTHIRAIGKDAGHPNIIIIYNNDINNNYSILNVLSEKEKIFNSTYNQQWFNVHPALFENTYDVTIECCAYIPEITNANYEYFKDSIIFSISDLDCIKYDKYKDKYKGSYIITIWKLEEIEGNLQYTYIKQVNTDYALALGSTVNILNELSDQSISNLKSQDLILLNSIISNIGQEQLNSNYYNWLIIKNKQSEEYNTNDNNTLDEYRNDLNLIMQYDDNVEIKTNHLVHTHSSSRYISNINDISITNSLYPKYNRYEETISATPKNIDVIVQKSSPVSSRESVITINGNIITNIESLIEQIKQQNTTETITVDSNIKNVKISSLSNSGENYYEYIFNDNVPTIDFKEVFNRNVNILNRLNVISIDNTGALYNAYIGTSYDNNDKSVLHIGSNNLNINVGSDTLINEIDKDKFNIHKTISIDFDNIKLNANNSIRLSKEPIYSYLKNNISYNIASIKLLDIVNTTIVDNDNNEKIVLSYSDSLFAKYETLEGNDYYLSINELIAKLNKDLSNYDENDVIINIKYNIINTVEKYKSLNDNNKYFIKLNKNDIFEINNNKQLTLYIPLKCEVMYYETLNNITNNNQINIYISLK